MSTRNYLIVAKANYSMTPQTVPPVEEFEDAGVETLAADLDWILVSAAFEDVESLIASYPLTFYPAPHDVYIDAGGERVEI